MDSPLDQPRPNDLIEEIRAYARDIAYLISIRECRQEFSDRGSDTWWHSVPYYTNPQKISSPAVNAFQRKWGSGQDHSAPAFNLLVNFGYLIAVTKITVKDMAYLNDGGPLPYYIPTKEAFALLEQPITPPKIFISYRHAESSAFALLVEARLRLKGINPNDIFIDKDIKTGDVWHEEVVERIRNCEWFICLIGKTTLASPYVLKEIEYAEHFERQIAALWHNDLKIHNNCPLALQTNNGIQITGESAREYETAISQLLNDMGYPTY